MKKLLSMILCLIVVLALFSGCGRPDDTPTSAPDGTNGGTSGDDTTVYAIRLGHVLAPTHPYQLGAEYFARIVEERSGGRMTVDTFPNSQLGNERDLIEGLQLGTVEMCMVSTAPLSGFTSDFLVFDLPFIFTDTATARACVDSEIGQGMLDALTSQGVIGMCYWENGFRSVTNSARPIVQPSDLQGLKIRTMENPIHMDSFRVMGADPTPMAFGELYTALQQRTIDAQENPLAIIDTSAFYEVQTYLSLTEHFYAPTPVLVSASFYNSLPSDLQDILMDCVREARDYERDLLDEMNDRLITELADRGVQINEVDKTIFIQAVQGVYEKYTGDGPDQIPAELIERVQNFTS